MDLYGDLLPKSNSDIVAASGGDESNNYITSGGWANIERSSLDSTTAAEKSAKICEESVKSTSSSVVATKPMAFAFKPRQASKIVRISKLSTVPLSAAKISTSGATGHVGLTAVTTTTTVTNSVATMSTGSVSATEHAAIPIGSFEVDTAAEGEAYDPAKPNDYLQICKEREERKRSVELAELNTLRMEERAREESAAERRKQEAYARGDMQQLQQIALATDGGGRGRGRGQSNLPAWMSVPGVAAGPDPAPAAQVVDGPAPAPAPVAPNLLFTNPTSVLMLLNMAGVGEDLDGLAAEVREECTSYGPVLDCLVHRGRGTDSGSGLRTFVHFAQQEYSIRAFRALNGRYFDGAKITASFYNEDKFLQHQLDD